MTDPGNLKLSISRLFMDLKINYKKNKKSVDKPIKAVYNAINKYIYKSVEN